MSEENININNKDLHLILMKECQKLIEKKDEYLNLFADESTDLALLKKLYDKLPVYYNQYIRAILHAPLAMYKPVSPNTAAAIGSAIGGTAVGIVAALNAKEREEVYRKNAQDVITSKIETGTTSEQLYACRSSIINLLSMKESTRRDWEEMVSVIRMEVKKEKEKEEEEERRKKAQAEEERSKIFKWVTFIIIIAMVLTMLSEMF